MATRIPCHPFSAEFPAASFPEQKTINERPVLAFDAAADETARWTSVAPQGITSTITLIISYFMASATTGAVRFQAQIEAISDGDTTDLDAATSFDTANSAGETVPGTAGFPSQLTITMTNADSIAAGDLVRISINRDADGTSGTDDAAGDCCFLLAELRDA